MFPSNIVMKQCIHSHALLNLVTNWSLYWSHTENNGRCHSVIRSWWNCRPCCCEYWPSPSSLWSHSTMCRHCPDLQWLYQCLPYGNQHSNTKDPIIVLPVRVLRAANSCGSAEHAECHGKKRPRWMASPPPFRCKRCGHCQATCGTSSEFPINIANKACGGGNNSNSTSPSSSENPAPHAPNAMQSTKLQKLKSLAPSLVFLCFLHCRTQEAANYTTIVEGLFAEDVDKMEINVIGPTSSTSK